MKRFVALLFTILLPILICGCNNDHNLPRTTVNFYYKTEPLDHISKNGVFTVEIRNARANSDDYQYLLEQYLNGARSANCISPFPAGTTLKSISINDSSASVTLSPHLSMLSGSDLTIACICLARTIFDMTGVQSVQISAQNNLVNSEPYITITTNSFTMNDVVINAPVPIND